MYVHVSQVTDYDRVGRWQIPPSWPKREEEGPRGDSRGLHGGFTRRSEAVAVVGVGLERLEGLDGLASRDAGGGIDGGPRWKVPAVGEAFVSRCAMGAKHDVRRRSRLARSTREAQGSQLARAPQLGRRL